VLVFKKADNKDTANYNLQHQQAVGSLPVHGSSTSCRHAHQDQQLQTHTVVNIWTNQQIKPTSLHLNSNHTVTRHTLPNGEICDGKIILRHTHEDDTEIVGLQVTRMSCTQMNI
jgi:hypothetical protein